MTKLFTSSKYLLQQIASLLLYQSVFRTSVGEAYLKLLHNLYTFSSETKINRPTAINCLQAYSNWFKSLATINQSWQDYLINQILIDDNPFSQKIQTQSLESLTPSLTKAVKHDLKILQNIYNCSTEKISHWVTTASQYP
ncbi:MAG TPA: AAA+ family ATPase, partial [Xenococcaceae cyanobacterium]